MENENDPETIRTSDLSLRRAALYPAELRGQADHGGGFARPITPNRPRSILDNLFVPFCRGLWLLAGGSAELVPINRAHLRLRQRGELRSHGMVRRQGCVKEYIVRLSRLGLHSPYKITTSQGELFDRWTKRNHHTHR